MTEEVQLSDQESIEKRYNEKVQELIESGFSPRKARRYLDSIAKRKITKFMKGRKKK